LIIPLHAGNPGTMTGSGNWTYLLTGATPVLIDAGVGKQEHLDSIAAHVPDGPAHIVVTHAHDDHASGAAALAARWPNARFSKMRWPERDSKYPVEWHYVSDGDVLTAGDGSIQVIHTPGHAPDHISLWHDPTRSLFCGDLVVRGSTVVIPASLGGSLAAYLESLNRVSALAPVRLLPAHGPAIDDPQTLIREYITHRHTRERQVLAALEAGLSDLDAITSRIYTALDPALKPMARESVLAHLLKLDQEGVVQRVGDSWQMRAIY
jgi:glyoxylase-like metal-dependent hydrolase (beta-lactamase superfamily II)